MSILPSPLHPLVVHMPIALTVLTPLFAIGALWAIRRGANYRRAWGMAVGSLALLVTSGWVALQTGEREEERVEQVVAETLIEGHEEAAETFLVASGVVLLVAAAGVVRGRTGAVARWVATIGTVALVAAGYKVGHSGGALVYGGGAGSAYATGAAAAMEQPGDDDHR
ncbi:MAG: hypothetical protein HOP28_10170 [Gemmatimonadales bacterium]|nr:hypothetical protein [Gemmatimonadales bacterium]